MYNTPVENIPVYFHWYIMWIQNRRIRERECECEKSYIRFDLVYKTLFKHTHFLHSNSHPVTFKDFLHTTGIYI